MSPLATLLSNNRDWAARQVERDPTFFDRLCAIQTPDYLWIGCADSRVPANEIVGLVPGELFVHRNVANIVSPDDANCTAVIQYAVETLRVEHIIVCGHYGCGGVETAMANSVSGPIDRWLQHVRDVRRAYASELEALGDLESRARRLAELNVIEQVRGVGRVAAVREAWLRGQSLAVHGWIYDLRDGLLRDLHVSIAGLAA